MSSDKLITALELADQFSIELLTDCIRNEEINLDSKSDELYKRILGRKRLLDRKLFITPKNVTSSLEMDPLFDRSTKAHQLIRIERINLAVFAYNIFKGRELEECIDAFYEKIIFQDEVTTLDEIDFYVKLRHMGLVNYQEENGITGSTDLEQAIEDFFPLNSELMNCISGRPDYNAFDAIVQYRREIENELPGLHEVRMSRMQFKKLLTEFIRKRKNKIENRLRLASTLMITNSPETNLITYKNTSSIETTYEVTPVLPRPTGNKIASVISKKTGGRKLSEKEVFSHVVKDEQPITASSIEELRKKEIFKASMDADEDELTATKPVIEISSGSEQSDTDDEDDFSNMEGRDVGIEPSHVQEMNVHDKDDVEVNESPHIQLSKHSQAAETEVTNAVRVQVKNTRQPRVISVDSPEIDELNEDSQNEDSIDQTSRAQDTEINNTDDTEVEGPSEVVQNGSDEARDVVLNDSQNNELNEDMDMDGSDEIAYDEPNDEGHTNSPYIPEDEESNTNNDEVYEEPQVQVVIEKNPTEADGSDPESTETSSYHPRPTLESNFKRRKIRKTTEVWTEEEIKALEEGLLKFRRPYWADIIRLAGPKLHRRTGPSLKDKARTMIRQLKRAGITRLEDMGPYRYVLSPDYDKRYDRVTIDNETVVRSIRRRR
ncbi:hypothetical protein BD770DRAFT_402485 [Pilaira anomala]|nr:hypothetical protein BD770DRAFT_402485 [Pilaira anomala]